jgi:hypothetical protein
VSFFYFRSLAATDMFSALRYAIVEWHLGVEHFPHNQSKRIRVVSCCWLAHLGHLQDFRWGPNIEGFVFVKHIRVFSQF